MVGSRAPTRMAHFELRLALTLYCTSAWRWRGTIEGKVRSGHGGHDRIRLYQYPTLQWTPQQMRKREAAP